jgi:hypothetical protein
MAVFALPSFYHALHYLKLKYAKAPFVLSILGMINYLKSGLLLPLKLIARLFS